MPGWALRSRRVLLTPRGSLRKLPPPPGLSDGRCMLNAELPGQYVSALLADLTLSSDGSLDHRDMLEGQGDDKGQDDEMPEFARQPLPPFAPHRSHGPVGPGSPFGIWQIHSNVWKFCFRNRHVRSHRATCRWAVSASRQRAWSYGAGFQCYKSTV